MSLGAAGETKPGYCRGNVTHPLAPPMMLMPDHIDVPLHFLHIAFTSFHDPLQDRES